MLNTQPKRRSILSRILNPKYIMVYSTVAVFLVIYLVGAIAYGDKGFTSLRTFLLLFTDNAYIGISAVGMTMVLITGGIDLSVAAVASLTGMFIAYGNTILGINPFICIGFALVVGVGLGLLMGATIHYLNVPPFITTLTGMFLARGVCSLISRESISISNEAIDALAGWRFYFQHLVDGQWERIKPVAYIDATVILFIVMIIIGTIILQKTRFGRNVYAIGGSEQSAKLMGLPVARTKVLVYGFNGLCSVLSGRGLCALRQIRLEPGPAGRGVGRDFRYGHRRHAFDRRRGVHARYALRRIAQGHDSGR